MGTKTNSQLWDEIIALRLLLAAEIKKNDGLRNMVNNLQKEGKKDVK